MKIISWNINGLGRHFSDVKRLIEEHKPDFLCLQKVRNNATREKYEIEGYKAIYNICDVGDYSGVMMYAKLPEDIGDDSPWTYLPKQLTVDPILSKDGHLQAFKCEDFILVNAYVPYANEKIDGAVETRKIWDKHFRKFITELSSEMPVVICGDMNVVHTELDSTSSRWDNSKPCYSTWDRDNFNALLSSANLLDAYRVYYPKEPAATYYGDFRGLGVGDRIDYFLVSKSLLDKLYFCDIIIDFVEGQSDPIVIEITNRKGYSDNDYPFTEDCEPFIDNFPVLKAAHNFCAFHDSILQSLNYQLLPDGSVNIDFVIDDLSLRFIKVRLFETNISDTICTFFYSIKFYVKECFGRDKYIVMETDNDLVKIVAEKIIVLDV